MKDILKIAAFTVILILMIGLLGFPFRGGYWYLRGYLADRDCRIAGIQEEPEGQVDVLNVGDSLADIAITPVEMFRDYGITSYVMGRDLQKCTETYYAIKQARQHQPVKVVLWEVHNLCKHQFIKYHYVWKRLIEGKGIRKYFKGYVVNEKVTPDDREMPYLNYSVTEAFEIPEDQLYVFDKIYDYCQKEGIKLVLYAVPSPHCYNMKMHNGYAKLAQEYGLDFLDGNIDAEKIGIDLKADYFDDDADHLNLSGTRKMTAYLADYLVRECGLEDHRGDADYQSWTDIISRKRSRSRKGPLTTTERNTGLRDKSTDIVGSELCNTGAINTATCCQSWVTAACVLQKRETV